MGWINVVRKYIKKYHKDTGNYLFTLSDIVKRYIKLIAKKAKSEGITPARTLSRVLSTNQIYGVSIVGKINNKNIYYFDPKIKKNKKPKKYPNASRVAVECLEYIAGFSEIFIQHAGNIGEFKIPGTNYYADGYCKEYNTIYEFHGSYFHAHPDRCNPDELHGHKKIKNSQIYKDTLKREEEIRKLGYKLVVIWEHEWKVFQKLCMY